MKSDGVDPTLDAERVMSGGLDADLVTRTRAALAWWDAGGGGPTSSVTGSGAIGELEHEMAARCGVRHALATHSASFGLRAALIGVGVQPGSEVVCSALDWPAAASVALSLGARPVPADVAAQGFLLDADTVARRLTPKTAAVVATHVAGVPVDVPALREVCDPAGVPVIEDAAQALGAKVAGRSVGSFGAAAVFSFGPGKVVDSGEAGVLVTDDSELFRAAVAATQHPVRQLLAGIHPPNGLALTGRIEPVAAIRAAYGLEELLAVELAQRRTWALSLVERVRGVAGIKVPGEQPGTKFSWPVVPAVVEPQADQTLVDLGVEAPALGLSYVPTLLGRDDGSTPNAHAVAPLIRRLTSAHDGVGS